MMTSELYQSSHRREEKTDRSSLLTSVFADLHMPGTEIVARPAPSRKGPKAPLVLASPKANKGAIGTKKQLLKVAARAKRTLQHAAKEGQYMYLRARFQVRAQVHVHATKRRRRRAEKPEACVKMDADENADDAASDAGAGADSCGSICQRLIPASSEREPAASVHIVGVRNVSTTGTSNDGEGVGAYDVLLPPRTPWPEYFGIPTPSSSASESSMGPPTPSASEFPFSPYPTASASVSASMSQSRSRSFLGLRSERSASIDPTCTHGTGDSSGWSAWGILPLPLRFSSSDSSSAGDDHSDAQQQSDLYLQAMYAARAAQRLEAWEDEAAARVREAKKRARDREAREMESEMRRKRKEKARARARAQRAQEEAASNAKTMSALGWFQLD